MGMRGGVRKGEKEPIPVPQLGSVSKRLPALLVSGVPELTLQHGEHPQVGTQPGKDAICPSDPCCSGCYPAMPVATAGPRPAQDSSNGLAGISWSTSSCSDKTALTSKGTKCEWPGPGT